MKRFCTAIMLFSVALLPVSLWADDHADHEKSRPAAIAEVKAKDGATLGHFKLTEGANGLLAEIDLQAIPQGWHAVHMHEKGDCGAADFTSAGGHAKHQHHAQEHGFLVEGGMHTGDMPNIWAGADGEVKLHYFLPGLQLAELLDKDGAALIVHEGQDDYQSQPTGAAGARIACGVIKRQ